MAWIGNLGALQKVKCAASLRTSSERASTEKITLGGALKLQVGHRVRRVWDVSLADASAPADLSVLAAFVDGEYGNGPWVFVSDWAPGTNLLSPRAAVLDIGSSVNITAAGSMELPGGAIAGRSVVPNSTEQQSVLSRSEGGWERVPVIPGIPVTGSIHVLGAGSSVRLKFHDAAGTVLLDSAWVFSTQHLQRISVTEIAPAGSAFVLLLVRCVRAARPAITWTESVQPWSSGQGSPKTHIAGLGSDVSMAAPGSHYANASFTFKEVG